jgi:hypothetical protein
LRWIDIGLQRLEQVLGDTIKTALEGLHE